MAIVWACALTVDEYLAADRDIEVPRADCPACSAPMTFRSGYRRNLRQGEVFHRLWVVRAECGPCGTSHALLPSFALLRRFDPASVIGAVITAVAEAGVGVRRAVAETGVPHSTGRDWVRRFGARAAELAAGFAALAIELGDDGFAPRPTRSPSAAAVAALRAAWRALLVRVGRRAPPPWTFVSLITGGRLISTTTDPPSIFSGRRRFIPPAP